MNFKLCIDIIKLTIETLINHTLEYFQRWWIAWKKILYQTVKDIFINMMMNSRTTSNNLYSNRQIKDRIIYLQKVRIEKKLKIIWMRYQKFSIQKSNDLLQMGNQNISSLNHSKLMIILRNLRIQNEHTHFSPPRSVNHIFLLLIKKVKIIFKSSSIIKVSIWYI